MNIRSLKVFLFKTLNIKDGADKESTKEGILRDIEFKGINAWILIASILIASIGLNINAVALIIGAMLISPLMGPILGIGYAVATYDIVTLKKSLKNLGIAVAISLLTSTIYFLISPIHEIQSELLARTRPTLLDVIVAFFGGIAGIVAGSRKEKSNVIPGVAIATALMPPLCTAGFGLASGNFQFFISAFYLFFINSVFISLATWLVVKFLDFPKAKVIDIITSKKVHRYVALFSIITMIPSIFIGYNVIKESAFKVRAEQFIANELQNENIQIIEKRVTYQNDSSLIEIFATGEFLSEKDKISLFKRMARYNLHRTKLLLHQTGTNSEDLTGQISHAVKIGILDEIIRNGEQEKKKQQFLIDSLGRKISELNNYNTLYTNLSKELTILMPHVTQFTQARAFRSDIEKKTSDTINQIVLLWKKETTHAQRKEEKERLRQWFLIQTQKHDLEIIDRN